jgi:LPXTG-motif cell wall-anchored protein
MKQFILVVTLALILVLATTGAVFAHEAYLNINDDIEVGTETEIRVYWGHFPDTPDPQSAYFSQLPNGRFIIIEPDGTQRALTLEAQDEFYVARFTPTQAGDHWAVFSHNRGIIDWTHGEPAGNQLIWTDAKALLDVHGDDEVVAFSRLSGHDFEILPLVDGGHIHAGEDYMGQVLYFGKPVEGVTVLYYGPDDITGETVTGAGGTFAFPLTEEGNWLVKITYFDGDRAGNFEGTDIVGARYTTTLLLTPHSHDDDEDDYTNVAPPVNTNDNSNLGYIALIALLIVGAGFFFAKSKKSAAS